MLKSYKKVWFVRGTYGVEVGKHSTEAAAEADLQMVLNSPEWADVQSTYLKAVEVAQEYADRRNNITLEELVANIVEAMSVQMAVDTTIKSDLAEYSVTPRDILREVRDPNAPDNLADIATILQIWDGYKPHKPFVWYKWEITRWGRLRMKIAGRLHRINEWVWPDDPNYDPDDYDDYCCC